MQFCAFDCEGRVDAEGVTAVSIATDEGTYYTTDPFEGINKLREYASRGYRLVAHNAEYDIAVLLWQYLEDVKAIYLNERFNRGEWLYKEGESRVQIWDSLALSGGLSLAGVGDALKLPKLPTPKSLLGDDFSKRDWKCDRHDVWECLECYATRDAEIVLAYMNSYEHFLGDFGVIPQRTIGSAAVGLWRSIDNPEPCYLRSKDYADFARSGYFGGRVECFKIGHMGPIYTADVTSMYPSVMLSEPMPDPRSTNFYEHEVQNESILNYPGCSECTITVPNMWLPPLPVLSEGKLLFPIGSVHGVWAHCEIRNAIYQGCHIDRIHRSLYSSRALYPFTEYVNTLYQIRAEYKAKGDARQLTVKILLNSLYGRMGLGSLQEEEVIRPMPARMDFRDFQGCRAVDIGSIYLLAEENQRTSIPKFCNVLWASTITAAARVKLYTYMQLQGRALAYVDTDSIYSLAPIVGADKGLGYLEEEDSWDTATILAPKLYRLQDGDHTRKTRAKGVPKAFADQFISTGEAVYDHPIRPRQAFVNGIAPGTWVPMKKSMGQTAPKRHVLNPSAVIDGGGYSDTEPLLASPSVDDSDALPEPL